MHYVIWFHILKQNVKLPLSLRKYSLVHAAIWILFIQKDFKVVSESSKLEKWRSDEPRTIKLSFLCINSFCVLPSKSITRQVTSIKEVSICVNDCEEQPNFTRKQSLVALPLHSHDLACNYTQWQTNLNKKPGNNIL